MTDRAIGILAAHDEPCSKHMLARLLSFLEIGAVAERLSRIRGDSVAFAPS